MNAQNAQNAQNASFHPVSVLSVDCPECAAAVDVGAQPMVHEIVPCADCGAELELLCLDPLTAELAPEVEEDWGE